MIRAAPGVWSGVRLALALALAAAALCVHPGAATGAVSLTTPYPAVDLEPGGTATFALHVWASGRQRVDLSISSIPAGWTASLRGAGSAISAVYTDRRSPPEVELEVEAPPQAAEGVQRIVVEAAAADGSTATLELDVRIVRSEQGGVILATEFPTLRGPADATFTFDLELANETLEETRFALEAVGPPGWQVEARPSGETQAATLAVAAGESAGIVVEADPPDDVPAGSYPIALRVSGDGRAATAELQVEIVGNFAMTLTTPNERLNADVSAGNPTELQLLVVNDGTAPLVDVQLTATPPSGWKVEFQPETLDAVRPQEVATARVTITPAGDAVAGDYLVSLSARTPEVSDTIELRTTVETSRVWGIVGLVLIAAAVVGLALVFRRFGRR